MGAPSWLPAAASFGPPIRAAQTSGDLIETTAGRQRHLFPARSARKWKNLNSPLWNSRSAPAMASSGAPGPPQAGLSALQQPRAPTRVRHWPAVQVSLHAHRAAAGHSPTQSRRQSSGRPARQILKINRAASAQVAGAGRLNRIPSRRPQWAPFGRRRSALEIVRKHGRPNWAIGRRRRPALITFTSAIGDTQPAGLLSGVSNNLTSTERAAQIALGGEPAPAGVFVVSRLDRRHSIAALIMLDELSAPRSRAGDYSRRPPAANKKAFLVRSPARGPAARPATRRNSIFGADFRASRSLIGCASVPAPRRRLAPEQISTRRTCLGAINYAPNRRAGSCRCCCCCRRRQPVCPVSAQDHGDLKCHLHAKSQTNLLFSRADQSGETAAAEVILKRLACVGVDVCGDPSRAATTSLNAKS
jgi:hypothetical protein